MFLATVSHWHMDVKSAGFLGLRLVSGASTEFAYVHPCTRQDPL